MSSNLLSVDEVVKRWPTSSARDWLLSFLDRVRDDCSVIAVVVVGSSVRSSSSSEDLDLVAICRDRTLVRERAPIEVDLRTFNVDQIDRDVERGNDLLAWSLRYGEPVYDPDGIWAQLVQRWRGRLPLPDPETSKARAEAALEHLTAMRAAGDADAVIDLEVSYLTQLARVALAKANIFPASRPELAGQLRSIGDTALAAELERALAARDARRTSTPV